jgi:hypothetical protein
VTFSVTPLWGGVTFSVTPLWSGTTFLVTLLQIIFTNLFEIFFQFVNFLETNIGRGIQFHVDEK